MGKKKKFKRKKIDEEERIRVGRKREEKKGGFVPFSNSPTFQGGKFLEKGEEPYNKKEAIKRKKKRKRKRKKKTQTPRLM